MMSIDQVFLTVFLRYAIDIDVVVITICPVRKRKFGEVDQDAHLQLRL